MAFVRRTRVFISPPNLSVARSQSTRLDTSPHNGQVQWGRPYVLQPPELQKLDSFPVARRSVLSATTFETPIAKFK